ncbi:MAG TPA: hypothetical protein VFL92_06015, partial [Sphingomonas sp.]|nr:hypothetical protein [Sphingomonas sp.]
VTPPPMGDPDALDRLLSFRGNAPTLIVLPKWATVPMSGRSGWVQAIGAVGTGASALSKIAPHLGLIAGTKLPRAAHPPKGVPRLARARIGRQALQQRLSGSGFRPVLLDADGRVVIAAIPNLPIYVLAEPDLLNNQGLADPWVARQGWRIVDDLATTNEIAFDLTLNGFARGKSTLKLLFEPPFAAVSLCVLLAALLAGLHGLARFGAAAEPGRAIAFGKRALVDNAAQLFRAARKEHRAGGAYALLTRDLAAQAVAAPRALSGEALAMWLDAAAPEADDPPFATLAWRAEAAANRTELLAAARALYRWRRNRTG